MLRGSKEEAAPSNVTMPASSSSSTTTSQSSPELIKQNCIGFSDHSTFDISRVCKDDRKSTLNHKATELRLGLPGSESPERNADTCLELDEKPLFPLHPSNESEHSSQDAVISGYRRGFSDAMDGFMQFINSSMPPVKERRPPVKSFRKNSLALPSKSTEQVEGAKAAAGTTLFVKVSMDGAPYLRKVNLLKYAAYKELSHAVRKMFGCFTPEYELTYEDKDGDWMLVGDIPWEIFIGTCRRLRIMKSSDAIV
ncbi:auxin-responsive protein IAA9-like isoform X2 [Punica granatum]|uniref:Auxin-responsive protein n=1 Tax=Punica granatum TaxID=22663 RepID=A0A6P8C394_PUNGR|nr:auxin-responsive protein IAA9-like isoform X2 [Punica granatum]